jgi:hypothetical protein
MLGLLGMISLASQRLTRTCAESYQPTMHTARRAHAVVYRAQYVYVLGEYNDDDGLRE